MHGLGSQGLRFSLGCSIDCLGVGLGFEALGFNIDGSGLARKRHMSRFVDVHQVSCTYMYIHILMYIFNVLEFAVSLPLSPDVFLCDPGLHPVMVRIYAVCICWDYIGIIVSHSPLSTSKSW